MLHVILGWILAMFPQIWFLDFEFAQPPGENPEVRCLVAHELGGDSMRLWRDELGSESPICFDQNALAVAYYSSAEWNCFLSLGWELPANVLDLYVEFRWLTNGTPLPCGRGLFGALTYFGIDAIDSVEKQEMRDLAQRSGEYSPGERHRLLDYCESDVVSVAKLYRAMAPHLDWPRALLRGRYCKAAARMESAGVPLDQSVLKSLKENWDGVKSHLVREVDHDFNVYIDRSASLPKSRLATEIRQESQEWDIDPTHVRSVLNDLRRQQREVAAEENDAVDQVLSQFVSEGDRPAFLRRLRSAEDVDQIPQFDEILEFARREFPQLVEGEDSDSDRQFLDRLRRGKLTSPPRSESIREAAKQVYYSTRQTSFLDDVAANVPASQYSFSSALFAEYLVRHAIPWPRHPSGSLDLSDDTFRDMAKSHPQLASLRELRQTLSQMRLSDLAVGRDGRNRCLLSMFASKTGRNQPSNASFIFGPSVWLRSLITPPPGKCLAYIDYAQQEFAIAAALSGDQRMQEAYLSGDPYLAFAKQAGAAPDNATKLSHGDVRDQFKVCALAVQYGMGQESLALKLNQPVARARTLLRLHKQTYPKYWAWSESAVDHAMLKGNLYTVFGWRLLLGPEVNPRSLANFPCQANGAEILRLACCLLTESGIKVCAPVHDAVLIEYEAGDETTLEKAQRIMCQAGEIVLGGFPLRTDAQAIAAGERYQDKRGERMWQAVTEILKQIPGRQPEPDPCQWGMVQPVPCSLDTGDH